MRGVEIATTAGGREIAHPDFEGFWARAEELGPGLHPPVGLHARPPARRALPGEHRRQPDRDDRRAVAHHLLGAARPPPGPAHPRRPRRRLSAVLHRPVRPCLAARPDPQTPRAAPSEYLRRLYFDALVYGPAALAALVAQVGADRVMVGTDYPFDMGVEDPLDRLRAAPLDDAQREAIRGGNAAALGLVPA